MEISPISKGTSSKKEADDANERGTTAPSLSDADWPDLSPKEQEKLHPCWKILSRLFVIDQLP
jgi:hypothetical protein